jgi:hypothetical protein
MDRCKQGGWLRLEGRLLAIDLIPRKDSRLTFTCEIEEVKIGGNFEFDYEFVDDEEGGAPKLMGMLLGFLSVDIAFWRPAILLVKKSRQPILLSDLVW